MRAFFECLRDGLFNLKLYCRTTYIWLALVALWFVNCWSMPSSEAWRRALYVVQQREYARLLDNVEKLILAYEEELRRCRAMRGLLEELWSEVGSRDQLDQNEQYKWLQSHVQQYIAMLDRARTLRRQLQRELGQ